MGTDGDERNVRFQRVWSEHHRQVLAYCIRRVDRAAADDACAEVFVVVWRRLDDVPAQPATLPYLYRIAGNVVANQRRALGRRVRLDQRLRAVQPSIPIDAAGCDDDRLVVDAVRKLRLPDREIVMLHAWEDLPHDQIAEILGMNRAAVDQRLHRAYRRLERSLAGRTAMGSANHSTTAGEGTA